MRALLSFLLFVPLSLCLSGPSPGQPAEPKKPAPKSRGPVKLTDEGLALHRDALLIDGHNDLPWQFRNHADFSFRRFDIAKPQPLLHTDIERLKKGGVGAQFWSAYVDADTAKKKTAVKETLE